MERRDVMVVHVDTRLCRRRLRRSGRGGRCAEPERGNAAGKESAACRICRRSRGLAAAAGAEKTVTRRLPVRVLSS
jgi:hypothetical protein